MRQPEADITVLLKKLKAVDSNAAELIIAAVYPELREIVRAYMARERDNHTLQPTALIHEAWMRLADQTRVDWRARAHFYGVAAAMMRRVLVDHARQRIAAKRGDGQPPVSLDWLRVADTNEKLEEIVAVHEALSTLSSFDSQQARIVEMRYFVGLNVDETADALGVAPRTVDREWSMARAWLRLQLEK